MRFSISILIAMVVSTVSFAAPYSTSSHDFVCDGGVVDGYKVQIRTETVDGSRKLIYSRYWRYLSFVLEDETTFDVKGAGQLFSNLILSAYADDQQSIPVTAQVAIDLSDADMKGELAIGMSTQAPQELGVESVEPKVIALEKCYFTK